MKVLKSVYLLLILVGSSFANELINAATKGDAGHVGRLLRKGADVNLKDKDGGTALIAASMKGHKDIVKILLDAGAKVNLQDENGYTALMAAYFYGHNASVCKDIIKMLLDAGANADLRNNDNAPAALIWASLRGDKDIVKLLLESGVNIDLKDENAATALQWATLSRHQDIENLLKTIDSIESGSEKFEDQDDEIKELLIKRWMSLYKKNKDQQTLERLKTIKKLAFESPKILSIKDDILIRNFLSNVNRSKLSGFEDVDIITQS